MDDESHFDHFLFFENSIFFSTAFICIGILFGLVRSNIIKYYVGPSLATIHTI
jgi:hypothetical protein